MAVFDDYDNGDTRTTGQKDRDFLRDFGEQLEATPEGRANLAKLRARQELGERTGQIDRALTPEQEIEKVIDEGFGFTETDAHEAMVPVVDRLDAIPKAELKKLQEAVKRSYGNAEDREAIERHSMIFATGDIDMVSSQYSYEDDVKAAKALLAANGMTAQYGDLALADKYSLVNLASWGRIMQERQKMSPGGSSFATRAIAAARLAKGKK
jgi:hypothetical protein